MNFPRQTRVVIKDGTDLDGQHGTVFSVGSDSNPYSDPIDYGFRYIAVDGMRGASVKVHVDFLQTEIEIVE